MSNPSARTDGKGILHGTGELIPANTLLYTTDHAEAMYLALNKILHGDPLEHLDSGNVKMACDALSAYREAVK